MVCGNHRSGLLIHLLDVLAILKRLPQVKNMTAAVLCGHPLDQLRKGRQGRLDIGD